jgi:class 3 adenylate cyclase
MENEMLTSELKGNRTLATVLFTDCVGFSARMSMNEEHTLDLIRRDLKLMTKICEEFEGRVLKSTGDGLLMCFSSAVKAVECAIAIQQAIAEVVRTLPPSDALMHRIGIHLADMYITPTDVMGNGVNIAARLQTEADPGGICISQTVYDVAKHGLQLATEYLGPRELKNIREVVPAYRVVLDAKAAPEDPYLETVRFLEQSEHVSRIRKLIFYVCKNHWENDERKLATLNMRGIIHEFLGLASNYEQLRGLLNRAVGTLSKQSEYHLVANELLKGVAKFYAPDQSLQLWQGELLTTPEEAIFLEPPPATLPTLHQQVAQKIDQDGDAVRLKKLLYYVVQRRWESDPARLQPVSTVQLLEQISQQSPDRVAVETLVNQFVQTLNKRAEYALVALTLLRYLGLLYGETPSEGSTASPIALNLATALPVNSDSLPVFMDSEAHQTLYPTIATQLDQHPHSLRFKKLIFYICHGQWLKQSEPLEQVPTVALLEELHRIAPAFNQLQQALHTVVSNLSKPAEYGAIAQLLLQTLRPLYHPVSAGKPIPVTATVRPAEPLPQPPLATVTSSPPQAAIEKAELAPDPPPTTPSSVSLFDVRLGILKYTNPLKAKILAFSALHADFGFQDQDWFHLKTYELDGLLRNLVARCRNYTDLEHLLYSTAHRLPQLDDLVQTADTVVKYLRSFYLHGNPTLLAALATPDETRISLDDFEVATQELADSPADEQTQGVLPPPVRPAQDDQDGTQLNFNTQLLATPDPFPSTEG